MTAYIRDEASKGRPPRIIRPPCVICGKPLARTTIEIRGQRRSVCGLNGSGFFCTVRCAAEWALCKVEGTWETYENDPDQDWRVPIVVDDPTSWPRKSPVKSPEIEPSTGREA